MEEQKVIIENAMTKKDWIMMLVPIVANGIIIFFLQKWISQKIDQINKRNSIRDSVYKTFWDQSQAYTLFITRMIKEAQEDYTSFINNFFRLKDLTDEMIAFYDANKEDLKKVDKEYNDLQSAWNDIDEAVTTGPRKAAMQEPDFDACLQALKDASGDLTKAVRRNY